MLGGDISDLPAQAKDLTRELYHWLATDSLGALMGAAVGVALYFLLVLLRGQARRRLSRKATFGSWSWVLLKVVARTRSAFLMVVSARVVALLFNAPESWVRVIGFFFTIAMAVQAAFWVRELMISLVERRAQESADEHGAISSAVGVLTVIINVVVWAITAVILLDNLGVNVTGLVAGLGIGGIAIGLAAQGIFSDLFAALAILMDQPFRKGEVIQIGGPQGVVGTVEHIGLKSTRLRALSGEMVIMSNANILNQQVNNMANYTERRVVLLLSVIYQTPVAVLETLPAVLEAIVRGVAKTEFSRAHLVEFSPSAIDFELVFLVKDVDLVPMFDAREQVALGIIRRFEELGVQFAFPAQVSYLAGPDGLIVDPHAPDMAPLAPPHRMTAMRRGKKADDSL